MNRVQTELVESLRGLMKNPYGCAFCDYGVLRDRTKDHDNDCEWLRARDALGDAVAVNAMLTDTPESR